jgi:thiol:disulfide interchange protein DsbD
MRATLALLLLIAGLAQAQVGGNPLPSPFGQPGSTPQFLPVEEAYQLEVEVRDDGSLRIYWQIADSYYLYQHRFTFKLMDASGEVPLAVEFPEALQHEDEYFGQVQVYYDHADIVAVPQRREGQATLTLGSQGCADAGLCYPPQSFLTRDFKRRYVHHFAESLDIGELLGQLRRHAFAGRLVVRIANVSRGRFT